MPADPAPPWTPADVEAVARAVAIFFAHNRQPHMGGDPFARVMPHRRRDLDDAVAAALAALAPAMARAWEEGREAGVGWLQDQADSTAAMMAAAEDDDAAALETWVALWRKKARLASALPNPYAKETT